MVKSGLRWVLVLAISWSTQTAWGVSLDWTPVGGTGDGALEVMFMGTVGAVAPMDVSQWIVDVTPQSAVMLSGVPTSSWAYGCSATSAGMIFGYYDRLGYSNVYTGPTNGGVAPLTNLGHSTSLVATKLGVDGVAARGHVDDYWVSTNSSGPDPWVANGWTEHAWADCTADFMGTNQWKWDFDGGGTINYNFDGATALFSYGTATKLYDYTPSASAGLPQTALCHGLRLFVESRGYEVSYEDGHYQNFTQKTDNQVAGGFSFLDFQSEIDAGRPVMIQVTGHSMVGVGYEAATNTIYLHDTWGDYVTSMIWGGSYSGMAMQAVTVLRLDPISTGSIVATDSHGTWQITRQQFVAPNTLEIDKTANDMNYFDVEFQVTDGLTSMVVDDPVLNNTGVDWTGYHFQLGYWEGDEFVPSTDGDGLAFLTGHSSDVFPNVTTLSEDELYFHGGVVDAGGLVSLLLNIDLPGDSSFDFALRQWAVPEPSGVALLGFSALAFLAFGRRRARMNGA